MFVIIVAFILDSSSYPTPSHSNWMHFELFSFSQLEENKSKDHSHEVRLDSNPRNNVIVLHIPVSWSLEHGWWWVIFIPGYSNSATSHWKIILSSELKKKHTNILPAKKNIEISPRPNLGNFHSGHISKGVIMKHCISTARYQVCPMQPEPLNEKLLM